MIRVVRPEFEPIELSNARSKRLPELRKRAQNGETLKSTDFKDYGVAKKALAACLSDKCWYCERPVEVTYDGTDHRRPKTEAKRGGSHPTYGYWWLAWTWENLLFACDACNKVKGTKFPLTPSSVPLVPEEMPPGRENALLLDPTVDDPLDHIRFILEKDGRWRPIGTTEKGRNTIRVLQLDGLEGRSKILDHYRDHVNDRVRPRLREFHEALKSKDLQSAYEIWHAMCRRLLRGSSPYAALSHDAIAILASREVGREFMLPRPPFVPGSIAGM